MLVEFTKLKLMLMKSEPDVQFDQRCKEGMVLVDFVDCTLKGVSKDNSLKPIVLMINEPRKVLKFEGVEISDVLLSFKIQRDRIHRKLKIRQTVYCCRLLRRFKMKGSRAVNELRIVTLLPAPSSVKLERCYGCYEYQELVGALKDLCFYANFLCRYTTTYGKAKWKKLAIGVLRYLVCTQTVGLMYYLSDVPVPKKWKNGIDMVMRVDSNFAERSCDSKSSSNLVLQMNGCTIDVACLLQRKPAQDNAEAEWYGFAAACEWIEWYRGFSSELEIKFDGSTAMWWDGTLMCADGRMSRHRRVSKNE